MALEGPMPRKLPIELYRLIFSHISSPTDVRSLRRSCTLFRTESSTVHYHSVIINGPKPPRWSMHYLDSIASNARAGVLDGAGIARASYIQTLKIRLMTESYDVFKLHKEALEAALMELPNLTQYEVTKEKETRHRGRWWEAETRHVAPLPLKAPFSLRDLKIVDLHVPQHIVHFLYQHPLIESLHVREQNVTSPQPYPLNFSTICHLSSTQGVNKKRGGYLPDDFLPNIKAICADTNLAKIIMPNRNIVAFRSFGDYGAWFGVEYPKIVNFGILTEIDVRGFPNLSEWFPNVHALFLRISLPRGCKLDTRFVKIWLGLKMMRIQVTLKEDELDDYATQFFSWAPKLDVIEYILPSGGWRFFRHEFPESIVNYERYIVS